MAPLGQAGMHIPSRSHLDSSIVATPSNMEMAFSGQIRMHSPEVRHFFGSTTIFMLSNLTRTGRKKLIYTKARLHKEATLTVRLETQSIQYPDVREWFHQITAFLTHPLKAYFKVTRYFLIKSTGLYDNFALRSPSSPRSCSRFTNSIFFSECSRNI
jgi:hypothetical protein